MRSKTPLLARILGYAIGMPLAAFIVSSFGYWGAGVALALIFGGLLWHRWYAGYWID